VVVAMAALEGSVGPDLPGGRRRRKLQRVDSGVDDELDFRLDFSRLFEQAEGKAGREAEADMAVAATLGRRASVRGDLGALRADLQKEAPLVGRLSGAQVLDFDGVGGHA